MFMHAYADEEEKEVIIVHICCMVNILTLKDQILNIKIINVQKWIQTSVLIKAQFNYRLSLHQLSVLWIKNVYKTKTGKSNINNNTQQEKWPWQNHGAAKNRKVSGNDCK